MWVDELFFVVVFGQFYFVVQVLVLVEFGLGVNVIVEFVVWVDVVFFVEVFVVGQCVVFDYWGECGVYVYFGGVVVEVQVVFWIEFLVCDVGYQVGGWCDVVVVVDIYVLLVDVGVVVFGFL